jgi:hypothetical protein
VNIVHMKMTFRLEGAVVSPLGSFISALRYAL